MVDVSEYKAGLNAPAVRISGRILTNDEYKKISKEQLLFLLGEKEGKYLEQLIEQIELIFTPPKKTPNPFKKESIKEIDKQIASLQQRKKQLQEVK